MGFPGVSSQFSSARGVGVASALQQPTYTGAVMHSGLSSATLFVANDFHNILDWGMVRKWTHKPCFISYPICSHIARHILQKGKQFRDFGLLAWFSQLCAHMPTQLCLENTGPDWSVNLHGPVTPSIVSPNCGPPGLSTAPYMVPRTKCRYDIRSPLAMNPTARLHATFLIYRRWKAKCPKSNGRIGVQTNQAEVL